jgi:hypothetical protein
MRIGLVLREARETKKMARMACDYGIDLGVQTELVIENEDYCEAP